MPKYVEVSPDYYGDGWYDPRSEQWFKKELGLITIPDDADLTNVTRYLRFNYLIEVKEPKKVDTSDQKVMKASAGQLLAEEAVKEAATEVTEGAPEKEATVVADEVTQDTGAVEEATTEGDTAVAVDDKQVCPQCGKKYKDLEKHLKTCKAGKPEEVPAVAEADVEAK